jgi:inward rectifier potassium channel
MSDLGQTRVIAHSSLGVVAIGLKKRPLADSYHRLVTGSWAQVFVVFGVVYLVTEALFEVAHYALADAGSVQRGSVLAAIVALSRGVPFAEVRSAFAPRAVAAGLLDGFTGFVRWAELVLGAGIVLAKFALLKARVLFSEVAVVAPHGSSQALLFRMANERTSHVVDAKVSVMLVRNELDEGGELVRRAHDLPLVRGGTALFSHAWTAVHELDRESPLAGESEASLANSDGEIMVTFSGYDEGLTRVIHARHVYPAGRVRWGARFAPIVQVLPDGRRAVDFRRFHEVIAVEPAKAERTPRRVRGA